MEDVIPLRDARTHQESFGSDHELGRDSLEAKSENARLINGEPSVKHVRFADETSSPEGLFPRLSKDLDETPFAATSMLGMNAIAQRSHENVGYTYEEDSLNDGRKTLEDKAGIILVSYSISTI